MFSQTLFSLLLCILAGLRQIRDYAKKVLLTQGKRINYPAITPVGKRLIHAILSFL